MIDKREKILKEARDIAEKNLRQCYFEGKILASLRNFSDFWARDTFWAFPGVLTLGDFEIARNCLDLFLSYQRPDGNVPRKIALDWNAIKYVFKVSIKRRKSQPIFKGNIPLSNSKDENSLMIIAAGEYLKKTGDSEFLLKRYQKLKQAIDWYDKKITRGFVREYILSSWMDTIFKNGHVLYTNILYCQSLEAFSVISETLGKSQDAEIYKEKHKDFKKRINAEFWNGSFYDDELGKHKYFDVAGNVLACFFGIAGEDKAKIIINKLDELKNEIKKSRLLPAVYPKYPFWKIAPAAYIMGIPDYQNDISWIWIDILAVGAKFKCGLKEEAIRDFENICEIIIENGAVYETYFHDGKPYGRFLWKSAVPFAWASGLFLKIYSLITEKQS